jgi:16S rRNA (guanine(966)-N(2))-methyltransferase RsmD
MRIIAGKYRSRNIRMAKHPDIRPTKDRVREALFNIIGKFVQAATVLDAFAGSGAFGIEALSRGAKRVVFIDKDRRCIRVIRENLNSLGIKNNAVSIIKMDAMDAFGILERKKEKFDIVLLDPPYYRGMVKKSLIKLDHRDILAFPCIIVAEHHKEDFLPEELNNIILYRTVHYGDVCLTFYKTKKR